MSGCTEEAHGECFISANFKKMEVLPFFSQLHQAFSFEIVVWDSKLLRQSNWGKRGPF